MQTQKKSTSKKNISNDMKATIWNKYLTEDVGKANCMCCNKNEDSQCCVMAHKDKIVACALVTLTIAFTVTGFIIGHRMMGKGCCKKSEQE